MTRPAKVEDLLTRSPKLPKTWKTMYRKEVRERAIREMEVRAHEGN